MNTNHNYTDAQCGNRPMPCATVAAFLLCLITAFPIVAQRHAMGYLDCKAAYEKIVENLKQDDSPKVQMIYDLVDLSSTAERLDLKDEDNRRLYKNILTLRGNYAAKCGNYDDMVATATDYDYRFGSDETGKRFSEYVKKLIPRFTERAQGYWVTSHRDISGAPMLAMYISIDEAAGNYEAFIDPSCNLYNSAAYKNAITYLSSTEGVEYRPSKRTLTLTFMGGKLKQGNAELAESISKSSEQMSSKTTEGLAMANRDKPLSGKNVLGQTASEVFGRWGQGIARELAVSKATDYYVTMKMSEVVAGLVMKVMLDYNTFVNRSDGDSYMDDFVRREFYLYKASQWDRSEFSSKHGLYLSASLRDAATAYTTDERMDNNLREIIKIGNRVRYIYHNFYKPENKEALEYYNEFGNKDTVDFGELFYELESNRELYYVGVSIPFPVDKYGYYTGSYSLKKDPDFFDSPMFLLPILEQFDDEEEEIAGVRYKYQQIYDRDHKKYLKKLMDIVEPRYGTLNFVDKKGNDRSYCGFFEDYKFHGKGRIYDDFHGKGNVVEEGEYKKGKLQK